MTRRLFLHVGMPKCATTTVQDYLHRHRAALAGQGLRYEYHVSSQAYDQGNAARLAMQLLAGKHEQAWEQLDFFLRDEGGGDVLLSSEHFTGLAYATIMHTTLDAIRARGFEVVVICYLRRQDHWIESDYKQHVKDENDWTGSLRDLRNRRLESRALNFAWMLAYWASFVGAQNVIVVPLKPGQPRDYPVRALLQAVGAEALATAGRLDVRPGNVSPPTGLIEPARYLKAALLGQGLPTGLVKAELDRFFAEAPRAGPVPERRFLFPAEVRRRLVERFAGSNYDLAQQYLGGSGFDGEVEEDAASEAPLAEEAAQVLSRYWLYQHRGLRAYDRAWRGLRRVVRMLRRSG